MDARVLLGLIPDPCRRFDFALLIVNPVDYCLLTLIFVMYWVAENLYK